MTNNRAGEGGRGGNGSPTGFIRGGGGGNGGAGGGGGIYTTGKLTLNDVAMSDNRAGQGGAGGGGGTPEPPAWPTKAPLGAGAAAVARAGPVAASITPGPRRR